MKLLSLQFLVFFTVIALFVGLFGVFVKQEQITLLFLARVFFTACATTLIYFLVVRRGEKKK